MAMHRHLRRLERLHVSEPLYFVTTCTRGREPILASAPLAEILVAEWRSALDRHGWSIGSYVIMPDHAHFFCRAVRQSEALSVFVAAWKQWTSKAVDRLLNRAGGIWQAEFFDHVLRSDESYAQKWNYVRENPVRKGLVADADAWPYKGHIHFD